MGNKAYCKYYLVSAFMLIIPPSPTSGNRHKKVNKTFCDLSLCQLAKSEILMIE